MQIPFPEITSEVATIAPTDKAAPDDVEYVSYVHIFTESPNFHIPS